MLKKVNDQFLDPLPDLENVIGSPDQYRILPPRFKVINPNHAY